MQQASVCPLEMSKEKESTDTGKSWGMMRERKPEREGQKHLI